MSRREATEAPCRRCHAPLPLLPRATVRCVYCLEEQPLPARVEAPIGEHQALAERLDERLAQNARWEKLRSYHSVVIKLFVAQFFIFPPLGLAAYATVREVSAAELIWFAVIIFVGLPLSVLPLVGFRYFQDRAVRRQLASLPFAVPDLRGDELHCRCPGCGAELRYAGAISTTCGHCNTTALMPRAMLDQRLAHQHARVIEARLRGEAEAAGIAEASKMNQRYLMPIFIIGTSLLPLVGGLIYAIAELLGGGE